MVGGGVSVWVGFIGGGGGLSLGVGVLWVCVGEGFFEILCGGFRLRVRGGLLVCCGGRESVWSYFGGVVF